MEARVAGPPSPEKSKDPLPATVVITPSTLTLRTRPLFMSAMYRLPAVSRASPSGVFKEAAIAGPPSPENLAVPLPA